MPDLSGVKPGDKLYIRERFGNIGSIAGVVKVTPGGRIVTANYVFDRHGRARGTRGFDLVSAEPARPEHFEKVERARRANALRLRDWGKLSLATLRRIDAILKAEETGSDA